MSASSSSCTRYCVRSNASSCSRKRLARSAAASGGRPSRTSTRSPITRLEWKVSRTTSAPRSINCHAWRRLRARAKTVASGYWRRIVRTVRRLASTSSIAMTNTRTLRAPGRTQQFAVGRIAVVDRAAEAAHELHLLLAVLDRDERDALRREQARDDLPEAAEARDQHLRLASLTSILSNLCGSRRRADQPAREADVQRRRERHRNADDRPRGARCRSRLDQPGARRHRRTRRRRIRRRAPARSRAAANRDCGSPPGLRPMP